MFDMMCGPILCFCLILPFARFARYKYTPSLDYPRIELAGFAEDDCQMFISMLYNANNSASCV